MDKSSLATLRKERGFSQGGMAAKVGVAASTYCQFETGARTIPSEMAEKIGEILNVDVQQIFLPIRFTIREQISQK